MSNLEKNALENPLGHEFIVPTGNDLVELQRRVDNVVDGRINHKLRNLAGTMFAVFDTAGQKWSPDEQATWSKCRTEFNQLEQEYREQKAREAGLI